MGGGYPGLNLVTLSRAPMGAGPCPGLNLALLHLLGREAARGSKFTVRLEIWSATRGWQEGLASRAWPVPAKVSVTCPRGMRDPPEHSWDSQPRVGWASGLAPLSGQHGHMFSQVSCPSELIPVSQTRLSDMAWWGQPSGSPHSETPRVHCVTPLTMGVPVDQGGC